MTTEEKLSRLMIGPTQADLDQAEAEWQADGPRRAALLRAMEASNHPNDWRAAKYLREAHRAMDEVWKIAKRVAA